MAIMIAIWSFGELIKFKLNELGDYGIIVILLKIYNYQIKIIIINYQLKLNTILRIK